MERGSGKEFLKFQTMPAKGGTQSERRPVVCRKRRTPMYEEGTCRRRGDHFVPARGEKKATARREGKRSGNAGAVVEKAPLSSLGKPEITTKTVSQGEGGRESNEPTYVRTSRAGEGNSEKFVCGKRRFR